MKIDLEELRPKHIPRLFLLAVAQAVTAFIDRRFPAMKVEDPMEAAPGPMTCLQCGHPEAEHEIMGWAQEDNSVAVFHCKNEDCGCKFGQKEKKV